VTRNGKIVAYPAAEVPSDIPTLVPIVQITSATPYKLVPDGDRRFKLARPWWQLGRRAEQPYMLARPPREQWHSTDEPGVYRAGPSCSVLPAEAV